MRSICDDIYAGIWRTCVDLSKWAIMLRYQSRRHRFLMDESEQALSVAAENADELESRTARKIITDSHLRRIWESRHAALVRPVAEQGRRTPQIVALRELNVGLLHRQALIDHVRRHKVTGEDRERLFRIFYGPKDIVGAIITEHRQYLLAVTSRICAAHLIGIMRDNVSQQLIDRYRSVYGDYFDLYCESATTADKYLADALQADLNAARERTKNVQRRLGSTKPDNRYSSLERQVIIARSGRYPIQNYMVG